jgi:hypothetical protein
VAYTTNNGCEGTTREEPRVVRAGIRGGRSSRLVHQASSYMVCGGRNRSSIAAM